MKNLLKIFTLLFCLISRGIQAQNIQLIMSPNPSPYISDWSNRIETATLIISNTSGHDIQVKIRTEIFDGKGALIAHTENDKMPVLTVPSGVNRYNPEDIIPLNAVSYKGTMTKSTINTGKIPEDNYKICVELLDPKGGGSIGTSSTVCKFFNIVSYQAPVLLSPTDKQEIPETGIKGIVFRWSPITPSPKAIITYKLQVWEVLEGQEPMTALRSNQPIVEKDLKGILQTQWPVEFSMPESGRRYVWTVTPLDDEGKKVVEDPGFAQPFVFAVGKQSSGINIVLLTPKDNATFSDLKSIGDFTWKLEGGKIEKPQYTIEIQQLDAKGKVQKIFSERTTGLKISASSIFKDVKLGAGNYSWTVKETTKNISSSTRSFLSSPCDPYLDLDSLKITCLGYDSIGNRKYQLCFRTVYSGFFNNIPVDLSYLLPGSGIVVKDPVNILAYTSLTPPLQNQAGSPLNYQAYCLDVAVSNSVTQIKVLLDGDFLNPADNQCRPGTNALFDSLPLCLCKDCDSLILNFDDLEISAVAGSSGQYTISGNLNVNQPIFGLEFQLQSYSYNANPLACTNGVNSIAQSGMFSATGSTINGTPVHIFNETASVGANTDNTISKIIKITSDTEMSGDVPINLILGLPGSIPGLDANCCEMNYTVCIKVKVFYEPDSCKSCTFSHCFQFNNSSSNQ